MKISNFKNLLKKNIKSTLNFPPTNNVPFSKIKNNFMELICNHLHWWGLELVIRKGALKRGFGVFYSCSWKCMLIQTWEIQSLNFIFLFKHLSFSWVSKTIWQPTNLQQLHSWSNSFKDVHPGVPNFQTLVHAKNSTRVSYINIW
jgi:hypothetical protein